MKISKIEIRNFRWIENFVSEIGDNLTVLDGENGFGKTTIFDALEFCFTWTVKRLSKDAWGKIPWSNKPETILKNKIKEESSVKITMSNNEVIIRIISCEQEWNLKEDYRIKEWQDVLNSMWINSSNFKDIFYIPQADSTTFLLSTTIEHSNFFDILLDTEEEKNFMIDNFDGRNAVNPPWKIRTLKNNLKTECDKLIGNINFCNTELQKIIQWNMDIIAINFIEIESLVSKIWNKKQSGKYTIDELNITNTTSYAYKWNNLLKLYQNRHNIKQYHVNNAILRYKKNLLENKDFIINNINYYQYYIRYINADYISNLDAQYASFKDYWEKFLLLEKEDVSLNGLVILFQGLDKCKDNPFYTKLLEINEKFRIEQNNIKSKNSEQKEYYDIFSSLVTFWDEKYLKKRGKELKITETKNLSEDICPLCRTEDTEQKIWEQIMFLKQKTGIISNTLNKNWGYALIYSKAFFEELTIYIKKLQNEKQKIENIQKGSTTLGMYVSILERYKSLNILTEEINLKDEIWEWIIENNINNLNNIIRKMEDSYIPLENFSDNDYGMFIEIFHSLFQSTYTRESWDACLDILKESELINNISFFENENKKVSNTEKNKLETARNKYERELRFYQNRISFLEEMQTILEKYKNNIDVEIKNYKSNKIHNISLPVYIFTQRIVKSYQWVWIYLTGNSINLIGWKNNRDSSPLFSLSSWQIEGLMIAVMLANNINKGKADLGVILIDDPIQSLDDLNILSFINLMRYQFSDCQIIISTHSDEFSRFIRYKFWRLYGEHCHKNINMKDRFLEVL